MVRFCFSLFLIVCDIFVLGCLVHYSFSGYGDNIVPPLKMDVCADKLIITDTKTTEDCLPVAAFSDQLSKIKNMEILDISPTDEIEGELLYLQNCLLDRVTSIKHSSGQMSLILSVLPLSFLAVRISALSLLNSFSSFLFFQKMYLRFLKPYHL